ncbi:ATP-binding cassette domain-containing protein [Mycoplasmatota bacterium zrk1]
MKKKLIEIKNLNKHFVLDKKNTVFAVRNVSFDIYEGETVGLVGESGCGKTTLGRTVKGIYDTTSGDIIYDGKSIVDATKKEKREYTKKAQMIFQDPYSSLNPRLTVSQIIAEGMNAHKMYSKEKQSEKIEELLEKVGLDKNHANRFPHEFSGGQRQRVGIARALALKPKFIVCDEPTSALDVSIQAQVINLLKELQNEFNLTFLFIAHDLSMVKYISDRVGVMYLGELVELTTSNRIYSSSVHPYTEALMSAIPIPDPEIESSRERIKIEGELPSPINIPSIGCSFYNRCGYATDDCKTKVMKMKEIYPGHFATCDRARKR